MIGARMVRRRLRLVSSLCVLALLPSCARILYPERVGNKGGAVDIVPLVVDIVLFIPGFVPGLIAIIVDFGTGAIYVQGNGGAALSEVGRLALRTAPNGEGFVVLENDAGEVTAMAPISRTADAPQRIELAPVAQDSTMLARLEQR